MTDKPAGELITVLAVDSNGELKVLLVDANQALKVITA